MKALILAAGYATRLYPLTKTYPKALLEVGNKVIIDYIVDKLRRIKEISEVIVVTNSKFFSCFKAWAKGQRLCKALSLVDDLTSTLQGRRGAVGDMDFVIRKKRIREDLLVIGGDNLFDGSLDEFLKFARAHKGSPIVGGFDIKAKLLARKYGVIKLDGSCRVIDFQEKPLQPRSTLVGMCLYYFPKEKLGLIREYLRRQRHKNDATGFYIDWLKDKVEVYGYVFRGRWFDIGDHKLYRKASLSFA
ncbi:MAG: nucleotidyltransferase family protein [Candidatus Omnitrophota bacterium]|nr:nucleotidyltransferase family protein [Candidatus Omnitrophota bacterium]